MKNQISSRSLLAGREILIFLLIHRIFSERLQPLSTAALDFGCQRPRVIGVIFLVLAVFEGLETGVDIPAQGVQLPLPEHEQPLAEAQSIAHHAPWAVVLAA